MAQATDPEGASPAGEQDNQFGREPDEESGGGYGNHAAPEESEDVGQADEDAG